MMIMIIRRIVIVIILIYKNGENNSKICCRSVLRNYFVFNIFVFLKDFVFSINKNKNRFKIISTNNF